ncbi:hypothetical protein Acsp03_14740 [Actinomadura sp. NBRC 104412]|nr:hypothetical protein Acsp03_14740 [Actinomadura sp. NBRC 104412]
MERAYSLPYGEARTVVVEEALRRAEEVGDRALIFDVRMALGTAYGYGGEPVKRFGTFSRCLAEYDADPAFYGARAAHLLLWEFKGIVSSLTDFPEVPLDRTRAVLDDMERRYKMGGHSLQAVYGRRTLVAKHLGNADAADRWFALWHTTPRDALSDCEGCDPGLKVSFLDWRARDEEALAIAEPVVTENLTCTEQPQTILTQMLRVYVRSGRLEEARGAHLRAYRLLRSRLNELELIGDHVEFCARTGNEARGLEIVQRHLGWLDRAPNPYADLWFSAAAALLLRRVEEIGHGELTIVRPAAEEGAEPVEVAVGELRAELARRAEELAARFDARNGNEHQSAVVREMLNAEPLVEHLPLTEYDRAPTSVTVPSTPTGTVEAHADVHDLDALLDIGEREWQDGRLDRAVPAWLRFDELAASAELTTLQRARRTDAEGARRYGENDIDGAVAEWRRAAELYEEADDLVSRHAALGRVGALLCGQGQTGEGFELLNASAAYLDEHAAGTRRALAARLRLSGTLLNENRADEARAALDGLEPEAPLDAGEVLLMRARTFLTTGETDTAAPLLHKARELFAGIGEKGQLADTCLLLAKVLSHRAHQAAEGHKEILDEALGLLDEAVSSAREAGNAWLATVAHAERGSLLLVMERPGDAVPDSAEAVAGFTAAGAMPQATYARLDLAGAYYSTGRHLEAAEAAEEAMPVLSRLGDPDAFRRARLLLAHAQRELGEEQAADLFTELAGEEDDDPQSAAGLLEMAGEVLTALDKDALAAERFGAAADAFETAGDPYGAVRARRQAGMCLLWARRPEAGLAELARARAAIGGIPSDNPAAITWETARVGYDEARVLAELGRLDEALAKVTEAIGGFTELDEKAAAETATGLRDEIKAALENTE